MEANERQVEQDIRGVKPVSIVSCSYKLVQCESRRLSCPESPDNLHRAAKLSKPPQLGHDYQCHAGRTANLHNSYAGYGKGVGGRDGLVTKARDLSCEALCSRT